MPEPKSPVIEGLQQFEVNIGGSQNGQPQYMPLPSFRGPDGRVMSRWELTPQEREWIAKGADVFLTLWCGGAYPPTQIEIRQKSSDPEPFREEFKLDFMLFTRIAQERMREAGQKNVCARCIESEMVALGGRAFLKPGIAHACEKGSLRAES